MPSAPGPPAAAPRRRPRRWVPPLRGAALPHWPDRYPAQASAPTASRCPPAAQTATAHLCRRRPPARACTEVLLPRTATGGRRCDGGGRSRPLQRPRAGAPARRRRWRGARKRSRCASRRRRAGGAARVLRKAATLCRNSRFGSASRSSAARHGSSVDSPGTGAIRPASAASSTPPPRQMPSAGPSAITTKKAPIARARRAAGKASLIQFIAIGISMPAPVAKTMRAAASCSQLGARADASAPPVPNSVAMTSRSRRGRRSARQPPATPMIMNGVPRRRRQPAG
jgi:hypothetical protein